VLIGLARGLAVLFLFIATAAGAGAQYGTPPPDAAETTREPLMHAEISPNLMPSDPAMLALAQFTFEPSTVFPDIGVPGPSIYRVLSGNITAHLPGEGHELIEFGVTITRATPQAEPEVDEELETDLIETLGPGDQILIPPEVPHELRNESAADTVLLAVAMTPLPPAAAGPLWPPAGVTPESLPAGVTMQSLDVGYGVQATMPPDEVTLSLDRLTIPPGAPLPARSDLVLSLIVVEKGGVTVSGDREIAVRRGEEGPVILATPETDVLLGAGDAALIQPGSAAILRSAGRQPLVVLDLILAPPGETGGTPEPGTATP
jgi:hypothetical protein